MLHNKMQPVEDTPGDLPVYAVILAGGQGTRLWPLSRAAQPKQFLDLKGDGQSLLQEAYRRAQAVVGSREQVLVVGLADNAAMLRQQLPDLPENNFILEPTGRNTAAGAALAAFLLKERTQEAVMLVLPADHLYLDEPAWLDAIHAAIAAASQTHRLVAIGIPPETPSSSYGYLHRGQQISLPRVQTAGRDVYEVVEFVEKPDKERAQLFLDSGEYLWNTGTFAWRLSSFDHALKSYLPDLHRSLASLENVGESGEQLAQLYASLESVSIDYGIMEKTQQVVVVRGDFQRVDLGTLSNLAEIWPGDANGNAGPSERISYDSHGNIVFSDVGLVGLIGVDNLVIIRSGEILLVCNKEKAAEVKNLVSALGQAGLERYR